MTVTNRRQPVDFAVTAEGAVSVTTPVFDCPPRQLVTDQENRGSLNTDEGRPRRRRGFDSGVDPTDVGNLASSGTRGRRCTLPELWSYEHRVCASIHLL